ncbi:bifunctional diguanylate cyclase/phosphodiesterase [Clostridium cavendishii]|nr:EAL domain-containing protein [Clostridium cavendishii]
MINKSTLYTNVNELQQFIIENEINLKKNVFAQVFLAYNDEAQINDILSTLKQNIKDVVIIGGSVNSAIYKGEFYEANTVITFTISDKIKARSILFNCNDYKENNTVDILMKDFITTDTKLLLIYADKNTVNSDLFIRKFNEQKVDIKVAGGVFGDFHKKGYLFNEENIIKGGIAFLALDSSYLEVNMIVNSGWQGIGKEHIITKVIDNAIYEIDDEPAMDFYKNKIGEFCKNDLVMRTQFPVLVSHDNYFTPRVINSLEDGGVLNITGIVNEGDRILFAYCNNGYLIKEAYKNYKCFEEINAEVVYVFYCSSRKFLLNGNLNCELSPIKESISLSGFCGLGEMFTYNNSSYFANQVNIILTLSESQNSKLSIHTEIPSNIEDEIYESLTLHSLIKNCNNELNEHNFALEKLIKNKTDKIEKLFAYDNTTSLKNRNSLIYKLKESKSSEKKLAILDVINFSEMNDFYGLEQGDNIIRNIGDILISYEKRYNLMCYRLYSDKFAILSNCNISSSEFETCMEEIYNDFNNIVFKICDLDTIPIRFRMSICCNNQDALEKAELALSYAKNNALYFIIYDEKLEIEKKSLDNILWSKKLKKALEEDRIIPFYQPIINNTSCKIEKFECLARLIEEDGTIVAPYKFLGVSKKMGLYNEITKSIINKSFEEFKNSEFSFSINLSIDDILDLTTRNFILNKLKNYSGNCRVIFEIVESEEILLFKDIKNFIRDIKSYGAKIAIDDFGSGYSNFIWLHELNIDQIKIDGSIIKALKIEDAKIKKVLKAIVDFSSSLGIETTAEFIEDKELYDIVTSIGVNYSQGYYFSAPIKDPFSILK